MAININNLLQQLPVIKFKNWPPTAKSLKKLVPALFLVLFAAVSLLASFGLGVAGIVTRSSGHRNLSFYWMLGSTLAALPLPFLCTLALKFLIDMVIVLGIEEMARKVTKKRKEENVELPVSDFQDGQSSTADESQNGSLDLLSSDLQTIESNLVEAVFHTYTIRSIYSGQFNALSKPAMRLSLVSFTLFTMALNMSLWMILITYDHVNQVEMQIWPYTLTEFGLGLICPVLVIAATTCIAIVIEFVTVGQVDLKVIIQHLIPSVSLVEGELVKTKQTQKYWVISNHFYMPIRNPVGGSGELKRAVDHSCSTWILVVISALAIMLAVSYFVNNSVALSETLSVSHVMQDYSLCDGYNCFTTFSFAYVNCSNSTDWAGHTTIYCFKFVRLGQDNNISTVLGLTLAFYLATVHFFHFVFIVTNELMKIYHTKLWGILLSGVGVCTFIGALVVLFQPNLVSLHLDTISLGQLFLVSVYGFLIGIVLCLGQVKEIVKAPATATNKSLPSPAESSSGRVKNESSTITGRGKEHSGDESPMATSTASLENLLSIPT